MTKPTDLNDLEERTWRSRFEDGLADVMLGIAILALGAGMHPDLALLGAVGPALAIMLWRPLHRRFVEPRLGYVEFGRKRLDEARRRLLLMTAASAVSVLAGLGLWAAHALGSGGFEAWLRGLGPLPFAFSLAALVAVAARLLRLARGYGYAGLIVLLAVAAHLAGIGLRVALVGAGAIVLVAGAVVLGRFLGRHPPTAESEVLP